MDLATEIYGNVQNLQNLLIPPAQEPIVGTLPPNFSNNYSAYQRADILSLIIFYNEDFGIVEGDTVPNCVLCLEISSLFNHILTFFMTLSCTIHK